MEITKELRPLLDAENAYIIEIKDSLLKIGESITDKSERDLKPIKALCDAATPGPWDAEFPSGRDTQWLDICGPDGKEILHAETQPLAYWMKDREAQEALNEQHMANLRFCAAARTAMPALIRELESLRARVAGLESDGARLDWLDAQIKCNGEWEAVHFWGNYQFTCANKGAKNAFENVREAINAARETGGKS